MMQFIQANVLNTTIIVESVNGEIFTDERDAPSSNTIESNKPDGGVSLFEENIWLILGFVAIALLGFLLFISIYRRSRKRKGD